jgi:hypothetical protein
LQLPLVIPGPGSTFGAYGLQPDDLRWAPMAARKAAIDVMYAQSQDTALASAYSKAQRDAFVMSQRLSALVKVEPGKAGADPVIDAAFAPITSAGRVSTALGRQLYQVAKLIAGRATVQGDRQVFFAQMGGFDTHAGQIADAEREGVLFFLRHKGKLSGPFFMSHACKVCPLPSDGTSKRNLTCHRVEQGAFARAVRAKNHHDLAWFDL